MENILRFGRLFFIYDAEYCQDEHDDPAEAICFLHPRRDEQTLGEDELHLVCQLMGTALFTERNMASFPDRVRLQHGEFVLHKEGRFIWAMHTSGEDETYVTRRQLTWTRRAVQLLHGGVARLASCSGDRAALRLRLGRALRPLAAAAGQHHSLERVFDALPRLDWAKKDDFICHQLGDVQTAVARVPGVLTCVLCWDGQLISNENFEEVVPLLLFASWLPEVVPISRGEVFCDDSFRQDAFDLVDYELTLPPATMVATIHLRGELYSQLRTAAEPLWHHETVTVVPTLSSIEECTENSGASCASPSGSSSPRDTDVNGNASADGRRRRGRRRRRRQRPAPSATATEPTPTAVDTDDAESPRALRRMIGALALQALSAECARAEPDPEPRVDEIPVRRLRRVTRRRSGPGRRSLSDLDVPEPFSNLAYLKRKQPELYRDELRKLQTRLRDNQPAFSRVAGNTYSFGIPRSNRLYTPRTTGAPSVDLLPVLGRALAWRPWRAARVGYATDVQARPSVQRAARRRFFSEGESLGTASAGWRTHQLAELVSERPGDLAPAAPLPVDQHRPATLYCKTSGKLKCYVLLEHQTGCMHSLVEKLDELLKRSLHELEVMLDSYRSIPSFHGQHYSFVTCRPSAEGRQLNSEGGARLDTRLLQLLHADLQADRLADCRIRTPTDVLLAQRRGAVETFYQQRTAGHQHGLPVVNGPLSRLDERARKRLGANHGVELAG